MDNPALAVHCVAVVSTTSEVSDVVYLLTSDEDATDAKWTVVANATPIKTGHDLVSFEFDKLLRGKSVHTLFARWPRKLAPFLYALL